MSPGNRPSHFGVNPAHITNPTSVVITPMITTNLPISRTIQKVARIERRHKLETECLYNSEIITRHSACRRRPAKTRFAAPFASWHGNTIPTLRKTKRPPRRNLRRLMKPTRYWAIPRNARNTTNSALIGIDRADFDHPHNGVRNRRKADITNGAAMAAASNSNSAGPASAISSKHFSAEAAIARLSVDLVDVRRQRSAEPMSKPTLWSHWKKR